LTRGQLNNIDWLAWAQHHLVEKPIELNRQDAVVCVPGIGLPPTRPGRPPQTSRTLDLRRSASTPRAAPYIIGWSKTNFQASFL
jgi:hypothetical protein